MKTIEELMCFEPQIAEPKSGPEPSLIHLLESYYISHGISTKDTKKFVSQYIEALKEWAK